jgi:hypothetical protein
LEPTYKIQAAENLTGQANLIINVSLTGISYLVIDSKNNCHTILCYHFAEDTNLEKTALIIKMSVSTQPILQESFSKISIIYAYPTAMLVPHALVENIDKKAVLELVHGDINDDYIRTDFVYKQNLHVLYVVPKLLDSVFSYLFSADNITHQYSLLPDLLPFKNDHLYCIFYNNCFTVQLIKDGRLQAIQSFAFKVPEDIAYYLLQLCESYAVSTDKVLLQIAGMIDSSSKIYEELYKYFLQIQFETLPKEFVYPNKMKQMPSHYFSHLFSMALCV